MAEEDGVRTSDGSLFSGPPQVILDLIARDRQGPTEQNRLCGEWWWHDGTLAVRVYVERLARPGVDGLLRGAESDWTARYVAADVGERLFLPLAPRENPSLGRVASPRGRSMLRQDFVDVEAVELGIQDASMMDLDLVLGYDQPGGGVGFVAGGVAHSWAYWERISRGHPRRGLVLRAVRGIRPPDFFCEHPVDEVVVGAGAADGQPVRVEFDAASIRAAGLEPHPPSVDVRNSRSCSDTELLPGRAQSNADFVRDQHLQNLDRGVSVRWGNRRERRLPRGRMAQNVEPFKPRLCLNGRPYNPCYVALLCTFYTILQVLMLLCSGSRLFGLDHKAGYHNLRIDPQYMEYFSYEFEGEFFCYTVLVFRWAPAAAIFHIVHQVLCDHLRDSFNLGNLHWIDDSLGGMRRGTALEPVPADLSVLRATPTSSTPLSLGEIETNSSAFLVGYNLQLSGLAVSMTETESAEEDGRYGKSFPFGLPVVPYLGLAIHVFLLGIGGLVGFSLPPVKAAKFESTRRAILDCWSTGEAAPFELVEKFAFRVISLSVLYPNSSGLLPLVFKAVGLERADLSRHNGRRQRGAASGRRVRGSAALVVELESVDFLVTGEVVPVRSARHYDMEVVVRACAGGVGWAVDGVERVGFGLYEGLIEHILLFPPHRRLRICLKGAPPPEWLGCSAFGRQGVRHVGWCRDGEDGLSYVQRGLLDRSAAGRAQEATLRSFYNACRGRNLEVIGVVREGELGVSRGASYRLRDEVVDAILLDYPALDTELFASGLDRRLPHFISREEDAFRCAWVSGREARGPHAVRSLANPPFCLIGPFLRLLAEEGLTCVLIHPPPAREVWGGLLRAMGVPGCTLASSDGGAVTEVYREPAWVACVGSGNRVLQATLVDGRRAAAPRHPASV